MIDSKLMFQIFLTKEEREFLVNLVKRKELKASYILENQEKYDKISVQRAKKTAEFCQQILEKLSDSKPFYEVTISEEEKLKKEVRDLKIRVDQLEALVRKKFPEDPSKL